MTTQATEPEPLVVPSGTFTLQRPPIDRSAALRAWDAADAYVLEYLATSDILSELDDRSDAVHIAVVNDSFGALATVLAARLPNAHIELVTDSVVTLRTTQANFERNGVARNVDEMNHQRGEILDLVVARIPRSLDLLSSQLMALRPRVNSETSVVGAAMTKHIHNSTLALFESNIGQVMTSLAKRKARLIHASVDEALAPTSNPWPKTDQVAVDNHTITLASFPGVFSSGRMDPGAELLATNLERATHADSPRTVVDLGCGTGILGTAAGLQWPTAQVRFIDESFNAICSASATWAATVGDDRATFVAADVADPTFDARPTCDLLLLNPPFHDDRGRGDAIAWAMFNAAHSMLSDHGELLVVGNRHLGYHVKLQRIFDNVETLASTPKFVLLRSQLFRGGS